MAAARNTKTVKRGPRAQGVPGKRYPLNVRTTWETRQLIERAAKESGRSLVQELEFRIERSFQEQSDRAAELGGRELYGLFKMMAGAAQMVEDR
mgnify:CR=1 FL=1